MADNKSIQKVFSLSDFRKKQLLGGIPERTRASYREYGYFGGGRQPSPVDTTNVDRIDYSNDTLVSSVRGGLPLSIRQAGAAGNSNFGYWGSASPARTNIQRIDYSSETSSIRANLNFAVSFGRTAIGNNNFAYWGGSYSTSPVIYRTQLERIEYSNDLSNVTLRGFLPSITRMSPGSLSRNNDFGYYASGIVSGPGVSSTVARLPYANDTATMLYRGSLVVARRLVGQGTGNSNFGYIAGTSGASSGTDVDRIDYSNDLSTATSRGKLSIAVIEVSASGNSNFGYFGGGSPLTSAVQRINYSNDTVVTSTRGPLSETRYEVRATSSHSFGGTPKSSYASNFTFPTVPNAGYFGGGTDGTNNLATIDKVDYANDTATASVRSALSSARSSLAATGNNFYGYFCGGAGNKSTVDRLDYTSDTQSVTTRGALQVASNESRAAVGNQNFGYVNANSAINRIDYSNDSTTSNRGNLLNSSLSLYWSSISSKTHGYFTGGYSSPTTYSGLDRIDFANDTLVASKRTNVPNTNYGMSGFGNNSFGYIGGGINSSYIRRVDYSNDTATISFRGPLSTSVNYLSSATGSQNFGYFGGGLAPSTPRKSQVDRINYSNDTAVASIRGPLSSAKSQLAATSPLDYGGAPIYFTNPLPEVLQKQIEFDDSNTLDLPFKRVLGSFGYFTNGDIGGNVYLTTVDRIDFSNDTATASQRGPTVVLRVASQATGNTNYGYVSAGYPNADARTVERIDYSNDLAIASRRGNLTQFHLYGCSLGLGNNNFGYFAGGQGPAFFSTVDRIDYSNDNVTASARSPLVAPKTNIDSAGVGNANFGYIGGGNVPSLSPSLVSSVERITYANDLSRTSIRGPLSTTRNGSISATGNSNFGYYLGGGSPTTSIVDRIDYSNDTAIASVRGPLLSGVRNNAATGNSNFGYIGSGSMQKYNYSNDTATVSGPLSRSRLLLGSTTNARSS